jgi:DNA-binding CsgD family transcriptional regulator
MGIGDTDELPSARPVNSVADASQTSGPPARRSFDLSVLTPAERDVVGLALDGLSVREISARLVVSESTVHTHLTHVYQKLGVRGRLDLLALARSPRQTPQTIEVASPRAGRARDLQTGVTIAAIGIVITLVLPVIAPVTALALLLGAVIAARESSFGLGVARLPLLLGALGCCLVALADVLLVRVAP